MISKIKQMMLDLCERSKMSEFEPWWKWHIRKVVEYSTKTAEKLGADTEIVEIAAWMHDIIKIRDETESKKHHVKGAEEAQLILEELDYEQDIIDKVKHCILTHSSDKKHKPETKEAEILASADALTHFDDFLDFVYYSLVLKKENLKNLKKGLIKKYKNSWNKLIPEHKKSAKENYKSIMLILNQESNF